MSAAATPFRWPSSWTDAESVDLLRTTPIDFLLLPADAKYDRVRTRARELNIAVAEAPPPEVTVAAGAWPGVKAGRGGGDASAGPTGVPWVDSNGWLVRLTAALHPGKKVWIEGPPKDRPFFPPASYELAVADCAAHGGQWILALDDHLAGGRGTDSPAWRRMSAATAYFHSHQDSSAFTPAAVLGIVSDFTGPNEFFSQELLNLLARAGMHYRIVLPDKLDLSGLRAILYADQQPPSEALRREAARFVESGGLLITTPVWGQHPGPVSPDAPPRFGIRASGKGRIAAALAAPDDPWQFANDSVILVSHRYDLVRCFNSGSFASYYTHSPDRKRALVHLLFYADRGPAEASVRIAGKFRTAAMSTVDRPQFSAVPAEFNGDWVEVHLPPVPPYVAIELTA